MKNLVVALAVFLSIGSLNAQKKAGSSTTVNNGPQKIAYVNSDSLLNKMETRKAAMVTLQKFEQDGYAELDAMQGEFQKKIQVFDATSGSMTPTMKKIEEDKLRKSSGAIEERQQSLNSELQQISQELNKPILERVQKAIEIVSVRNKITYVLEESVTLYCKGGINITNEVMTELLILDKAAMVK